MSKYLVTTRISRIVEANNEAAALTFGVSLVPRTLDAEDGITVEFEKVRDDWDDQFEKGSVGCKFRQLDFTEV